MPTKKDIQTLFRAIRNDDQATVRSLIENNAEFVHVCRQAPPKKDDGQSPLQVAFKTGRFAIARMLLDRGADPNFIEQSKVNTWRAPVVHDCLRSCAFTSGREGFGEAFALLKRMLKLGANPNAEDSYGNSCIDRFLLDARNQNHFQKSACWPEMVSDLKKIFAALIKAGADSRAALSRNDSMREFYRQHLA